MHAGSSCKSFDQCVTICLKEGASTWLYVQWNYIYLYSVVYFILLLSFWLAWFFIFLCNDHWHWCTHGLALLQALNGLFLGAVSMQSFKLHMVLISTGVCQFIPSLMTLTLHQSQMCQKQHFLWHLFHSCPILFKRCVAVSVVRRMEERARKKEAVSHQDLVVSQFTRALQDKSTSKTQQQKKCNTSQKQQCQ